MPKEKAKNKKKNDGMLYEVELIPPLPSRDHVLHILAEAIDKQHHKVTKGKIFNQENEKIRINQWKSLVHTCHIYNQILKDKQIDEVKKELKEIKNAMIYNEDPIEDESINDGLDKVEQTLKLLDGKSDISEHEDE